MKRPIRVVCADDCSDMLLLLRLTLGEMAGIEHVGEALQAGEIPLLVTDRQADVVILDLMMPGEDPLEIVRQLSEDQPKVGVLVFSGFDEPEIAERALAAGARGYLTKNASPEVIHRALTTVAQGGTYVAIR